MREWGHDFRPAYRRIAEARPLLSDADGTPTPVLAVTATATPDVRRDIVEQLGLRDPALVVRGFDRPNLVWSVTHTPDRERRAADLLREAGGDRARLRRHAHGDRGVGGPPGAAGLARRSLPRRARAGRARRRPGALDRGRDARSSPRRAPSAWASTSPTCAPSSTSPSRRRSRRTTRRPAAPGRDGLPSRAALLVAPDDDRTPRRMAETGHPLAPEVQAVYAAAGSLAQLAVGARARRADHARRGAPRGRRRPRRRRPSARPSSGWRRPACGVPRRRRADLVRVPGGPARAAPVRARGRAGRRRVRRGRAARAAGRGLLGVDAAARSTRSSGAPGLPEARVRAGLAFLAERRLVDVQAAGEGALRVTYAGPRTPTAPLDARALDRAPRPRACRGWTTSSPTPRPSGAGGSTCWRTSASPPRRAAATATSASAACRPAAVTPRDEPLLLALIAHVGRGDAPRAWLPGTPAARRDGLLTGSRRTASSASTTRSRASGRSRRKASAASERRADGHPRSRLHCTGSARHAASASRSASESEPSSRATRASVSNVVSV